MRVATTIVAASAVAVALAATSARASNVHIRVANGDAVSGAAGLKAADMNAGVVPAAATNTTTTTTNTTAKPMVAKTLGRQKCSVMNAYNWTDFTYVCEWFHPDSGFNIFYRRRDNASFVFECECQQNVEGSYTFFSASRWTYAQDGAVDCFSRRGQEVKNVMALFDSVSCKGTNRKYCDTKTKCTGW